MSYPMNSLEKAAPALKRNSSFRRMHDDVDNDGIVWNLSPAGKLKRYMTGVLIFALLLALGLGLGLGIEKGVEIEEAPVSLASRC